MSGPQTQREIKRSDLYPRAVVDGRELSMSLPARVRARVEALLVSKGEREEAEIA